MSKKEKSFEASLAKLEEIVTQLEEGDLSLEESLKLFEDGVKLSRECKERLEQAERRIEVLLKDKNGNPSLQAIEQKSLDDTDSTIEF
jgi:exodeoxyribonuclease VII small subunit